MNERQHVINCKQSTSVVLVTIDVLTASPAIDNRPTLSFNLSKRLMATNNACYSSTTRNGDFWPYSDLDMATQLLCVDRHDPTP